MLKYFREPLYTSMDIVGSRRWDRVMHGYGVGRFTAKCRRRAAAPRCLLAFYILHAAPLGLPATLPSILYFLLLPVAFLSCLSSCTQFSYHFVCLSYAALPFSSNHPRASVYRSDTETTDATVPCSLFAFVRGTSPFRMILRPAGIFELSEDR